MKITVRILAVMALAVAPLWAAAESVTLRFHYLPNNTKVVDIEPTNSVSAVIDDADKYFESVEFENIRYYWDALLFGTDPNKDSEYACGSMNLKLTDWFRSQKITNVSVEGCFYLEGDIKQGIYLYANDVQSGSSILTTNANVETKKKITSQLNEQCDYLNLKLSVARKVNQSDNRVFLYSMTIEYEQGEQVGPVAVNPADGIDNLTVGQEVTLDDCVVMEKDGQCFAYVLKLTNGQPEIFDNQPQTYSIPIVWAAEAKNDLFGNISGKIIESDGKKAIEIQGISQSEAPFEHIPPMIYINGSELDSELIRASDRIEFSHTLGDNVIIYYVKRTDIDIDPANATVDPALLDTPKNGPSHVAAENAADLDENRTFVYTGAFRLVHVDNLATTEQSNVTLKLQVHSAPTLTAGTAWKPSQVFALSNEVTTGIISSILNDDDEAAHYIDLQGRRVDAPVSGQILIRVSNHNAKPVIVK